MKLMQRILFKSLLTVLVVGLVGFNVVAFTQARSMTQYAPRDTITLNPQTTSGLEKLWVVLTGVNTPRPEYSHTPADVGLDSETVLINTRDGATLEAWFAAQEGAKGLVAMFHGYLASKESLLASAAVFYDMGYEVLLVDFQGSGGSSGNDVTLGWREGGDVAATLDYARGLRPNSPVYLYGISMGSAAILRSIAADGAQPDAIILESGFASLVKSVGHRYEAVGLPAFPAAEILVFWGSVQQGRNGFEHNPTEYARSVTVPSLLLHGSLDSGVTTAETESILANLPEPKRLVEFMGAGHELLVVYDESLWRDSVGAFLDGVAR